MDEESDRSSITVLPDQCGAITMETAFELLSNPVRQIGSYRNINLFGSLLQDVSKLRFQRSMMRLSSTLEPVNHGVVQASYKNLPHGALQGISRLDLLS